MRGDLLGWLRGRPLALVMGAGLIAAVLPFCVTQVFPFHDASGIVGLGGALARVGDPAANVGAFYDLDIRAYPSALYFGWAWLAGAFGVPVEVAFALFTAVFCVAALPLATAWLLRAFHRPPALALLALPIAYHHQIWYGFLGSSAAIPGLLTALAFVRRLHEPRAFDRGVVLDHLGLAGALLFVAAAHPFPLALTLAVIAPPLLWPPVAVERRRALLAIGARVLTLVPTAIFLGNWAAGFFNRPAGKRSLWKTVRTSFEFGTPALADAGQYLDWLGNGYRSGWDEVVPALALLTLAVFLVFGVADAPSPNPLPAARGEGTPAKRRDWIFIAWAAALLLGGYLFLPMKLVWPELWWGVRVRCVVPSFLILLLCVRPRVRGLRPLFLAPTVVAAVGFFLFVAVDFASYFRGRVLRGFDEAVAAIPPGQSVLGFTVRPDPHYTEAHPYLVQHYVARKGGRAVPHLRGHRGSYWITMKPPPESPPWGDPRVFDWAEHGNWDYFLLEKPLDAPPPEPMRVAPPGAVERVYAGGQFEVWRRRP